MIDAYKNACKKNEEEVEEEEVKEEETKENEDADNDLITKIRNVVKEMLASKNNEDKKEDKEEEPEEKENKILIILYLTVYEKLLNHTCLKSLNIKLGLKGLQKLIKNTVYNFFIKGIQNDFN